MHARLEDDELARIAGKVTELLEALILDKLGAVMAAIDELTTAVQGAQTALGTLQTTASEIEAAFNAANDDTAVSAAASALTDLTTGLTGVVTTLQALVTVPAEPAPPEPTPA